MSQPDYVAFISYSRRDEAQARWLQRKLEGYRVPRGLTTIDGKPVARRLRPVFRDNDELASSSSLSSQIAEALARSRSLILLASPHAAVSRWVNEEIRQYRHAGRGPIVVMVIDGVPYASEHPERGEAEALPLAIRKRDGAADGPREAEPNYADVRNGGRSLAFLRITAGILQVRFDDLRQRHARRVRQLIGIWAALGLVFATTAWVVYSRNVRSARVAQELKQSAEARSRAPALSLLLAREAWVENGELTAEIENALRRAMEVNTGMAASADAPLLAMAVKPRSNSFVTASALGTLTLWDAGATPKLHGARLGKLGGQIKSVSLGSGGTRLTAATLEAVHRWTLSADGKLSDHRELEVGFTDRVVSSAAADRFLVVRPKLSAPDGSISPGTDLLEYSWEPPAAEPRVLARLPTVALTAAATNDLQHVAIGTGGGELHLCDLDGSSDGVCRTFRACNSPQYVMQVAFSPDGEWVAAACLGGDVLAWPVARAASLTPVVACLGHRSWANQLVFSADGGWFASAANDRTVRLWRWPCGAADPHVLPTEHLVQQVAFAEGSGQTSQQAPARLAAADAAGLVYLWSLAPYAESDEAVDVTGQDSIAKTLIKLPGHDGSTQIGFAGALLASAGVDGTVRAWRTDYADPTGASDLLPSVDYSDHLIASADGNWLAVGRAVLTNATPAPLFVWHLGEKVSGRPFEGVNQGVATAAFDPKGRWFAAAKGGKVLLVPIAKAELGAPAELDPRNPLLVRLGDAESNTVNVVAFASDGSWLASGGDKGQLAVWAMSGSQPERSPFKFDSKGDVQRIFPLPAARSFVALTSEGCARLWDLSMAVGRIFSDTCGFEKAQFSALTLDGKWLVWAGDRRLRARSLDAQSGFGQETELKGSSDAIRSLAVGLDQVAVALADGSVLLWKLVPDADAVQGRTLAAGEHSTALAISEDGRLLASANQDGRVITWDLTASEPTLTRVELGRHHGRSSGATFLGSQRLATTGRDLVFFTADRNGSSPKGIRLWSLGASQLRLSAQAAAGRNLTREEWAKYLPTRPYQHTFPELGEPPAAASAPVPASSVANLHP